MGKGALYMPLTQQETFKTKLQRHNRLAVPTLLRWQYKIEAGELLKVSLKPLNQEGYGEEEFLAKVAIDGRLTIPKLTMQILEQAEGKNLTGAIFEVTISPAPAQSETSTP
jgi:bifunctional DNA-binding transcriptional regulator/antitoxin component of YhaV-PrlF toxin-antitoxin module